MLRKIFFFAKYPRFSRFSHFCKNAKIFTDSQIGFFYEKSNKRPKNTLKNAKSSLHDFPSNYLSTYFWVFFVFFSEKFKKFSQKFSAHQFPIAVTARGKTAVSYPRRSPAPAKSDSALPMLLTLRHQRARRATRARRPERSVGRRARVASAFGYGDARASPAGGPQARPQTNSSHPAPAPSGAPRGAPSIGRSPIILPAQRAGSAIRRNAHRGAARVYRDAPRRGKKKNCPTPW